MISRILLKGIFYLQDKKRLEDEKITLSNQSGDANEDKDNVLTSGDFRKTVN